MCHHTKHKFLTMLIIRPFTLIALVNVLFLTKLAFVLQVLFHLCRGFTYLNVCSITLVNVEFSTKFNLKLKKAMVTDLNYLN